MAKRELREPITTRPEQPFIVNDDLGDLERRADAGDGRRVADGGTNRTVPKHRQCPRCYEGELNGIGQCNGTYAKASSLTRRYYRCDRCAHTWIVNLTPEQVHDLPDEGLPIKAAAGSERSEL
jgi:hypothetical protein